MGQIGAIREVPVDELETMIGDGTVSDPFTIIAFARARARGLL
jgi:hypothetical protein